MWIFLFADLLLSAVPGFVLGVSLLGCLCLLPFLRDDIARPAPRWQP